MVHQCTIQTEIFPQINNYKDNTNKNKISFVLKIILGQLHRRQDVPRDVGLLQEDVQSRGILRNVSRISGQHYFGDFFTFYFVYFVILTDLT